MILKNGFTLVEGLVSMALFFVITGSGYVIFSKYSQPYAFEAEALKVRSVLDEAFLKATQAKCFDTSEPHKFGLCFEDSSYTLFTTLSDWDGRDLRYSQKYLLPEGISFINYSLPNDCSGAVSRAVVFEAVTGKTSTDGFVILKDASGAEKRLSVSKTGLVEIN